MSNQEDQARYKAFIKLVEQDKMLIGVDRIFARRFFVEPEFKDCRRSLGEPLYTEELVTKGAFYGAMLSMLASLALEVPLFGWWSLLIIPASVYAWFFLQSLVLTRRFRLLGPVFLALLSGGLFIAQPSLLTAWLLLLVGAVLLSVTTYTSATAFVRALSVRNAAAFSLFDGTEEVTFEQAQP